MPISYWSEITISALKFLFINNIFKIKFSNISSIAKFDLAVFESDKSKLSEYFDEFGFNAAEFVAKFDELISNGEIDASAEIWYFIFLT